MNIIVRQAIPEDAPSIALLVRELAGDDPCAVSAAYARAYVDSPWSFVLLDGDAEDVVGLLSFSVRPNLYHAGDAYLIEELIITGRKRGMGIGSALVEELIRVATARGYAEISVSAMAENSSALSFYERHGFTDRAVFLERHS